MLDYQIVFTVQAKDDLIDIGDYLTYTLLEPQNARNFIKGLRKAIFTLNENPNRYAFVDDIALSGQEIRCMPYKNYYVFYEVVDIRSLVIIVRIGSNRRNWKEVLKS